MKFRSYVPLSSERRLNSTDDRMSNTKYYVKTVACVKTDNFLSIFNRYNLIRLEYWIQNI